jgi:rhodanese-related sulfurtransferase
MSDESWRISPQEAHDKVTREGYTYVDVRTEAEFEAGHPAGSINVPIASNDFLVVMNALFAKDAKIVVGCQAGGRSKKAANALKTDGFTNVLDQRAGWDGAKTPFGQLSEPGWSRVGLPAESGKSTFKELQGRARS